MAGHIEVGKAGEAAALEYLGQNGYRILHTNWRYGRFELDIIAQTEDELVVIEVKTRSTGSMINPEDAVDNRKIRNIISATDFYIQCYNVDLPVRFDIISILGSYPHFEIDHIEDAFYPPVSIRKY